MAFTSNGRGTFILKRKLEGIGQIRVASGTNDPATLCDIHEHVGALHRRGDFATLCQVRDGKIRPVDLLTGWARGPRRRPTPEQTVYIIQARPSGNVKVGIARNVATRLASMQCATWETLTLLAVMPGGVDRERQLHRRFATHHIAREWFRPAPEILALAAEYSGRCDGAALAARTWADYGAERNPEQEPKDE